MSRKGKIEIEARGRAESNTGSKNRRSTSRNHTRMDSKISSRRELRAVEY